MPGWNPSFTFATAIATLALVPTAIGAPGGLAASATVLPISGYPGVKLVATYTFVPKGSCSAYHNPVTWSFGNTMNWATSPAPSGTGARCTSSTPPTAPPGGAAPGSYKVCGTDPPVSSTPACATYTINSPPPPPRPSPSPKSTPSNAPSPAPSPSGAPGAISGTPSPSAPAGSAPPGSRGGGGPDSSQPVSRTSPISLWPWTGLLLVLVLIAAGWRFRSWLIGVLENVVVMGRSGADLETELLHLAGAEPTPPAEAEAPEPDAASHDEERPAGAEPPA